MGDSRRKTGDRRQEWETRETGDGRQETLDRRDMSWEAGGGREGRWERVFCTDRKQSAKFEISISADIFCNSVM